MKKSQLKEAIKNEIKSVLSENQMTTDEAFRILRDIEAILPKRLSPSHIQLMGKALDHLQAGEITKMMDRERGLSETRLNQNVGLAHIKSSGENDGGRAMMSHLKHNDFKNAPDMEAYTDGFVKGASNSADYLKSKLGQAIRGGGDEESLMGLVGLNEISSTEANAQLMEIVEHQKSILNLLKELKKGADLDAAIRIIENEVGKTLTKVKNLEQIKGLQTTFADIREDRKAKEYIQSIEDPEEREAEKKRMFGDDDLKESFNPEVSRAVDRFITAMADKYGYSMQDAVYAIMAALKQRNYDGLNEVEDMDDDEMDKAAAKSAKKGDSITATSNKLQKLTKQMKDVAGSYKRAKKANATNDMEKYVEQLKKMTTEKKKLEKAL